MPAQGRRVPMICSALLGALVISCGGPPVYVLAPAAAPAPQGGLQQAAPPVPVQAAPRQQAPEAVAPPAPRAAPQVPAPGQRPDPGPEQGRAGGRPPGIRAPDIPLAPRSLDKQEWFDAIDKFCGDSGPRCVRVEFIFYQNDQSGKRHQINEPSDYSNCDVTKRRTPPGQYMELGSSFIVEVTCPPDDSAATGMQPGNNTSGTQPGNNTLGTQPGNKNMKGKTSAPGGPGG